MTIFSDAIQPDRRWGPPVPCKSLLGHSSGFLLEFPTVPLWIGAVFQDDTPHQQVVKEQVIHAQVIRADDEWKNGLEAGNPGSGLRRQSGQGALRLLRFDYADRKGLTNDTLIRS